MEKSFDGELTPMQRFWRLLKPDAKEIRNIYVYSAFNGLIYLSLPLGIQAIVNLIQGGQISTSWVILVCFVVLGIALMGILQIFQMRITENLQQKIFTRAAFEFTFRIPHIRMEVLYRHYAPELMNRFFDVMTVQKGLSKILIDFSTAGLHVLFGLLLLSLYHPFFILFSVALVLLISVILRYTGKRGLKASLNESKYKYQLAHWLEELARASSTFKLAGQTDLPMQRTNNFAENYLESRESHFKVLIRQFSLLVIFKVIVATGLLAIGGILVMDQQMNIGQFVAAEIIILLIMSSVEKLILSFEIVYDVLTALEKIGQVTDLELENDSGSVMPGSAEEGVSIQVENASYAYPGAREKVLKDLSFSVSAGEKIMITGPSGSGKSTLLPVLAGLYDVQEGHVSYNGLPRGNLSSESLYSAVGDLFSHEQIFQGSVIENISINRPQATNEQVQWAVKHMGLEDFIRSCPQGYNTILAPEGKGLPRHIVTKLLLARSIAARPRLLLLETPFELLDLKDRESIIRFLTSPENPWTLLAISTDTLLAQHCHRILILEQGSVSQQGTYEELSHILNPITPGHA